MTSEHPQLSGRKVLLGVTGGIAAYKAADLASKLTCAGAAVRTIMTDNACRLVTPATFEAVTGQPVYTSLWHESNDFKISHIQLADWADCVVIAPATANLIAKAAAGICDDLLSTTLCVCWDKKVLLAPAMNSRMWANPVVQRNCSILTDQLKFRLIGPESGRLACGTEGVGRMAEVPAIIEGIIRIL
ncbi:MAG: phosphopantothenoylcysteine decarboxylase [Planctomycetaceae bacterium]|nr:phosphopantothenoylcysteine decarboxylase [Planctomycetaceae bacterium]